MAGPYRLPRVGHGVQLFQEAAGVVTVTSAQVLVVNSATNVGVRIGHTGTNVSNVDRKDRDPDNLHPATYPYWVPN
jgi:hypothetical protein